MNKYVCEDCETKFYKKRAEKQYRCPKCGKLQCIPRHIIVEKAIRETNKLMTAISGGIIKM